MKAFFLPLLVAAAGCAGKSAPPAASPVISSFSATPAGIDAGQSTTLRWSVAGATALAIDHDVGVVTGLQEKAVSPAATTTYLLTATNAVGTSTSTATVTVTGTGGPGPAPTITTFTASPATIDAGGSATLGWTVTGATSLAIDQGVGAVTGTSKTVSPSATTTYTLTATNAGGSATATATVTVTPGAAPAISAFTASPASIAAGNSAILSWTATGADTLSIDNGVGAVTGTNVAVSPAATTTYTLTATNAHGSATKGTTVQVTSATGSGLWVSGYYAGYFWDWTGDDPAVAVAAVDMSTMTHLIFARYAPGAGTLGGSAGQLIDGAGTGHTAVEGLLVDKAHQSGVKAIMMVGGSGDGDGWFASTADSVRAAFVTAIVDKAVAKDYDGVDIDWEDNQSATQVQNQMIALLTDLRAEAANRPRYQSPHAPFYITFPAYWVNINIDLPLPEYRKTVASLVDQYNLMSYDMTYVGSGWQSWFWAALKDAEPAHPTSIEASIQAYVDLGVPRSKLGMGLGLYGGGYTMPITGPRQTADSGWGGDDSINTWQDFYALGMLSDANYTFDATAQTGYYSYSPPKEYRGTQVSVLITEDLQSIAAKGAWAKAGNCAGTIIWTVNYGYDSGLGTNPPMNAVKAAFR